MGAVQHAVVVHVYGLWCRRVSAGPLEFQRLPESSAHGDAGTGSSASSDQSGISASHGWKRIWDVPGIPENGFGGGSRCGSALPCDEQCVFSRCGDEGTLSKRICRGASI